VTTHSLAVEDAYCVRHVTWKHAASWVSALDQNADTGITAYCVRIFRRIGKRTIPSGSSIMILYHDRELCSDICLQRWIVSECITNASCNYTKKHLRASGVKIIKSFLCLSQKFVDPHSHCWLSRLSNMHALCCSSRHCDARHIKSRRP